jgi:DNA-binding transcriptional ArsR family regulator
MKPELKPTLWRTARALANADRLELLRLVYEAKNERDVTDLAKQMHLAVPTTSTYLRALNARGLISVIRSGLHVFYGTNSDRSLPAAAAIQSAFFEFFKSRKLPCDWADEFVPLFKGYSHPRREEIIRCLKRQPMLTFAGLQRASGIHPVTMTRHLNILVHAGIVTKDDERHYSLTPSANPISKAILESLK